MNANRDGGAVKAVQKRRYLLKSVGLIAATVSLRLGHVEAAVNTFPAVILTPTARHVTPQDVTDAGDMAFRRQQCRGISRPVRSSIVNCVGNLFHQIPVLMTISNAAPTVDAAIVERTKFPCKVGTIMSRLAHSSNVAMLAPKRFRSILSWNTQNIASTAGAGDVVSKKY
jgi:hypothetical protein